MRSIVFLTFLSLVAVTGSASYGSSGSFAMYYSDKAPAEQFDQYKLLVLDRIHHPSLQELSEGNKVLLGYISLGGVKPTDSYYNVLKDNHLFIEQTKNGKTSYVIDLRNPLWQKLLIEEIIPETLGQGFNGVFFDALESSLTLESADPGKYKGMSDAAVHLIRAVRMNYPAMKIMVSQAYGLLPRIASNIDMELGEAVVGKYDPEKKIYSRVELPVYRQQVQYLQDAKRQFPNLQIYTLDYADTKSNDEVSEIYRLQKSNGFIPYVTNVEVEEQATVTDKAKESVKP